MQTEVGLCQVMEWAAAYVDGETCIPETPDRLLTEKERAGLALIA